MKASLPMLVRAGFEKWRRYFSNDGRVSEYSFRKDGATFDFFCYWPTGAGFLSVYLFAGGRKPEQIEKRYPVLPYVRREFVGCTWRVPQDIDTALTFAYGDWRTPDTSWNYANERNEIRREEWMYSWRKEWCHLWSARTVRKRVEHILRQLRRRNRS
jgi:hypothetical protein